MSYKIDPEKLPEIRFVAGETQTRLFDVTLADGSAFDLTGCTADFSIQRPDSRSGTPIFHKAMSVETVDDHAYLSLELTSAETVAWFGMYVYQVSIRDSSDINHIPGHGDLIVANNIYHGFVGA